MRARYDTGLNCDITGNVARAHRSITRRRPPEPRRDSVALRQRPPVSLQFAQPLRGAVRDNAVAADARGASQQSRVRRGSSRGSYKKHPGDLLPDMRLTQQKHDGAHGLRTLLPDVPVILEKIAPPGCENHIIPPGATHPPCQRFLDAAPAGA